MKKKSFFTVLTFVFAIIALAFLAAQETLRWTVGVDMTPIRFFYTYPWIHFVHYGCWIACFFCARWAD
jgi:hypothetical protein